MRHITLDEIETRYDNKCIILSFDVYINKRYPTKKMYDANLVLIKDWDFRINDEPVYKIIKDRYGIRDELCTLEELYTINKPKVPEFFTDNDLTIV